MVFHRKWNRTITAALLGAVTMYATAMAEQSDNALNYEIELETVLEYDGSDFFWFHPRAAAVPAIGKRPARVIMTLQKHLNADDYYSGMYMMWTPMVKQDWRGPYEVPSLGWVRESDEVTVAVADVTPGYHAPTGKVLAVGAQVRYNTAGRQMDDVPLSNQTAYAVFDPKKNRWSSWKQFKVPDKVKFNYAFSACAQWLVEPDGSVLLPFYFGLNASTPWDVTVMRCAFDGETLTYIEHGDELSIDEGRGFAEPSITKFDGRYYLTIRSDARGYVAVSEDGLHYESFQPWLFDDGSELGSYSTQQHWVPHSEALFLSYTRSGADNDHIFRHRAPLFIAQVDPQTLRVIRSTERVLIPERGATLGNFGATMIDENESWVTVSEWIQNDSLRQRGATGATFVARILWSRPNALAAED